MEENYVKLIHLGGWYKCYGDSAKIVSFLMGYKLFEDTRTLQASVGFPEWSLEKVVEALASHEINYMLVHDEDKVHRYTNNNYEKFLFHDLPYSYIVSDKDNKKPFGEFEVKYEGEEPEKFIIGENISEDAELTKKVCEIETGETFVINDFHIQLLNKNIDYK